MTTPIPRRNPTHDADERFAFDLGTEAQVAHLNRVVECCHDAIFSIDLHERVVSWNPAAERTYGFSREEMLGNSVRRILPADRQQELQNILQGMQSRADYSSLETKRLRNDGQIIDVLLTVSPVHDNSARLIGASIIARDITSRKKAEAALLRKQRELEDFFENAVVGLHWVGPDGMIIWANRAEMESLGYQPEEYIGHHIAEFHADPQAINDILNRLSNNEKLHNYEAVLKCKDGSLKHVLISSSVLWEDGKFVHTRCFTVDVTARRLAEEALRRTEKMAATGRLAASIAHEINNPLAAVTNLIFLAKAAAAKPDVQQYLDLAEGEVRRVSEIAKRTLGFFKETREPVKRDLSILVADVLSVFRPRFESTGVQLECDCTPAEATVLEGEMRQVVANLILNAIDASVAGSKITVRVRANQDQATVTIADRGSGIPRGNRCRIFEPFFTTKRDTGTGLGLWVSREIVQRHGGTLRFRSSDSIPSWTVFRASIPKELRREHASTHVSTIATPSIHSRQIASEAVSRASEAEDG